MNSQSIDAFSVWGFTSVVYERGDRLSFFLSVISLLPLVFIAIIVTIAVFKPSRFWGFTAGGMLANFLISVVLKKAIRQPRPEHPWPLGGRADFGMPSNHSQFMSYLLFAALFSALEVAHERRRLGVRPSTPIGTHLHHSGGVIPYTKRISRRHAVRLAILLLLTALVGYSRVYTHYHTIEQVFAGFACGVICAAAFYLVRPIRAFLEVLNERVFLPIFFTLHEIFVNH